MKRCAIYARFSTEMQRASSLEDQIRNCRRFAAQMGWQILEDQVYQDTALSGFGVEQRPAYQHLVATALSAVPAFHVILVDAIVPSSDERDIERAGAPRAQTAGCAGAPTSASGAISSAV